MAITALHSASTGLSALSTQIDVVSNNLANVNTTGFKASRVNFEDLLYQQKGQPGVENANGNERPAGLLVGHGVRISNTQFDFSQGDAVPTEVPLDVSIDGPGFFQVRIVQDFGDGIGYTRAGNFFLNSERQVVLGNADGPLLEPPVQIPDDIGEDQISISADGRIFAIRPGEEPEQIEQITLANFANPAGLETIGGNIFVPTAASGPAIDGLLPGEATVGTLIQGFLEGSNVDPVKELVTLIKTQRAFEMNSQTIQAADETLQ
ncbi:MAG: flagellar basal-body rod protein FlgG, partial [Firmicutes bacterium]|nr:flagellar basal-body rod protein FlgG [Bacillota bacterium]